MFLITKLASSTDWSAKPSEKELHTFVHLHVRHGLPLIHGHYPLVILSSTAIRRIVNSYDLPWSPSYSFHWPTSHQQQAFPFQQYHIIVSSGLVKTWHRGRDNW